jgi:hypothetical protein
MPYLARAEENPENLPFCLHSFQNFREAFLAMFDDPERKSTAERKLFSLKQGNRSVAALPAEFQRWPYSAYFLRNHHFVFSILPSTTTLKMGCFEWNARQPSWPMSPKRLQWSVASANVALNVALDS